MLLVLADRRSFAPLPKGVLFNIVLFLTFFLSNAALSSFKAGVIINIRQIGMILLPMIYFLYPDRGIHVINKTTRTLIIILLLVFFLSDLLKIPFYATSLSNVPKSWRICASLISILLVVIQGVKIDPEGIKKTLLLALLTSFFLTLALGVLGLGPSAVTADDSTIDVGGSAGRFGNDNASFALIAVALLFHKEQFQRIFGRNLLLARVTCVSSIFILLLTFNRTMIMGMLLMTAYFLLRRLSAKKLLILGVLILASVRLMVWFYETNDTVKRQIDRRILIIYEKGWEGVQESGIKGNRDVLWKQYEQRLYDYPYIGVPMEEGLARTAFGYLSSITDMSMATVTLRFGVVAGLLYLLLLWCLLMQLRRKYPNDKDANKVYNILVLPLMMGFVCSFNIDLLSRHNFIYEFILCMMCFVFDNKLIYNYHLSHYQYRLLTKEIPYTTA